MHAIGEQSGSERITLEAAIGFTVKGKRERFGPVHATGALGAKRQAHWRASLTSSARSGLGWPAG